MKKKRQNKQGKTGWSFALQMIDADTKKYQLTYRNGRYRDKNIERLNS